MAALLDVTLPKGDPLTVHAAKGRERHHPCPWARPKASSRNRRPWHNWPSATSRTEGEVTIQRREYLNGHPEPRQRNP